MNQQPNDRIYFTDEHVSNNIWLFAPIPQH